MRVGSQDGWVTARCPHWQFDSGTVTTSSLYFKTLRQRRRPQSFRKAFAKFGATMSNGPTLSSLPLDIRDRILSWSPTRLTLLSLILTSKEAFYIPFSQHRTSLLLSTLRNEVGLGFEYAKVAMRAVCDLGNPTLVAHKRIPVYVCDRGSFYWEGEVGEYAFGEMVEVSRIGEIAEREYSIRCVLFNYMF